jgi:hypothetical protein
MRMRRNISESFRAWWNRNLGTCRETVLLVSESRDRKLVPREWLRLSLHVMFCRFCRRYQRQIEFISGIAGVAGTLTTHSGFALSDASRARMKTLLRE